jgi:hypothetical protein
LEKDDAPFDSQAETPMQRELGMNLSMAELRQRYGDDNAEFLAATLGDLTKNYDRLVYIEMPFEAELGFRARAAAIAADKGWDFEVIPGDLSLLRKLLGADWDQDFLIVQPGQSVTPSYDSDVLAAAAAAGAAAADCAACGND